MVFIKRLEMRGFKSFGARKASIPLEKGLTVITGPNGSGKSNVFDAIRFVLGDLSARSLRADKMSEIIFDGSLGEGPSKMAYVTIQMDNMDRRIPVDTETVTISRRVSTSGFSEYFLNGRQASRGQLVDMLHLAGLSSSGYNMIMQGTITRLADINPEERRRFIEELVGIAEYDAKKADARVQLQQAEMNLRIAAARISDVQARLDRLEEERNDALRFNFIQSELRRFRATLISNQIHLLSMDLVKLNESMLSKSRDVEKLRMEHEALQAKRDRVESDRRKFDEEVADKGSARLIDIQKTIGDIMARSAACRMEIESGRTSLRGFIKIREERMGQLQNLERRIREVKTSLPMLRKEKEELKALLDEKSTAYREVSTRLVQMKENLGVNTKTVQELENEINFLSRRMLKINAIMRSNATRHKIISDSLTSLKDRATSFEQTLVDLRQHLGELQMIHQEEQDGVTHLADSIGRNAQRRERLSAEVVEGETTVRLAREAVVEVEAQREAAERFLAEDASLERIEEMVEAGALMGVHGILGRSISIESRYRRALEVASAGWLRALVVEDAEVALRCVEILKKMRLSPLKFIPLKELRNDKAIEKPEIEGVMGQASSFVRSEERYIPAVNFVFGDTLVSFGPKSAFLASKAGYRTVDLNGDLYEAEGAIIAGFYRAPIELSSFVPSRRATESLTQSVNTLEKIVSKRKEDIDVIANDVTRLAEERARRMQLLTSVEDDIKSVEANIERIKQNEDILRKRVRSLGRYLEKGEQIQIKHQVEKEEQRKQFIDLAKKRKSLRSQIRPDVLGKYESDQTQLNIEVSDYERRLTKADSELGSLETSLETSLRPDFEAAQTDSRTLDRQITTFEQKIAQAQQALDESKKQLEELEKAKNALSESLGAVKHKRKEFEEELDLIDNQLRRLSRENEPANSDARRLELEIQARESEIRHLQEELHGLGYEKLVEATSEEVRNIEATMNLMRFELERLGSVNQLAVAQYSEQQDNYKQLSIRRNQLESERRSIVDFMEEIEKKKKDAFMQAFNGINQNFSRLFSKLTGGGNGQLNLQNPDDPFSAGVDIFVQFPGKGTRLVAGASGGEKSVTAVTFVLAIQSLSPTPFYIFDEIDAHLDHYNTERLADLLKEQAEYSQFVVITLRDVIMERADHLFGVYLQDGVSRMVSAKIQEAVA